jgi:DNA helicase HerA-like ATPase
MTQAEKTRVIAEELFRILMRSPIEDVKKAKVLLVFEEAHSLIPEWNSVAAEGDKNATNGTAKVILQGRKYGLGSLVITQRTANVSKSILNQCNTIFALRVFDDTGKGFLENYIGKDYADTLATLDERHAIAIGKGLRLKQPVIIRLNEREDVLAAGPAPAQPAVAPHQE